MESAWNCEWEILYGDKRKKYTKTFKTFEEAKKRIREMITSNCKGDPRIKRSFREMLSIDEYPKMRRAIAEFICEYLTRDEFYPEDFDFPSTDAIDYYEKKERVLSDDEEDEYDEYDEEEEEAKYYVPDDYDISISCDSILVRVDDLFLETDMVSMTDQGREYEFSLLFTEIGKFEQIKVTLTYVKYHFDKSAYPLLVLKLLQESDVHLKQREIGDALEKKYKFKAERKAIGRYINMLEMLGFGICHDKAGYYIPKNNPLSEEEIEIIKKALEVYPAIDEDQKEEITRKLS